MRTSMKLKNAVFMISLFSMSTLGHAGNRLDLSTRTIKTETFALQNPYSNDQLIVKTKIQDAFADGDLAYSTFIVEVALKRNGVITPQQLTRSSEAPISYRFDAIKKQLLITENFLARNQQCIQTLSISLDNDRLVLKFVNNQAAMKLESYE